ncbi:TonB-dependent receptor [Undibacterium sp. 10I3]|uniref:TonB-dependent receptor domain-containing protein n=1 Tax=Undibacterium sp. 10I3 TaxID=3048579 RepID=UPI002B2276D2|nr:TonB-dependent receptor [Undibacterium sp. 10I3]MEB0230352.1 TonB-dependent receptor [Undibacterium sp. 10I3]
MKNLQLKLMTRQILGAVVGLSMSSPILAFAENVVDAPSDVSENTVTIAGVKSAASKVAISQGSLAARSAQSEISDEFVRNYTAPTSDFSQIIQMAPAMYSFGPNGPGLGDTKTNFRGFSDGDYSILFDGIPFQDTNSPSHHSWAFFPAPFVGGAVIDRSPGSAASLGPANFGGSINLLSRNLETQKRISGTASLGTWNTSLIGAEFESGQFGRDGSSNLLFNAHELKSDGYQTLNKQQRDALSAKYQYVISPDTVLTLFGSYITVHSNTPNIKGATRSDIAKFGDNYLLASDPTQANYFAYNFYHVNTDFEYAGLTSNLGNGWKLDNKTYTYYYHNQQNYPGATIPLTTANTTANNSGTDKLNSYRTYGNILRLNRDTEMGTLRTGLWSEVADTNRYQIPSNPLTWIDSAIPNFRETFKTTLLQPFIEYELNLSKDLKVTAGVKYSSYKQDLTQFADNGKTVGNLNGAASIGHVASYHTFLPSIDAHYMLQANWSAYAQFATGDEIPPSNVFDVKNANVTALPASIKSKTIQIGSVWKGDSLTFDMDAYHIKFDNAYSSTTDAAGNTTFFANGSSVNQGIEAESTLVLGSGFNLYINGTYGSSKYSTSDQWVQNAPSDTETLGLNYQRNQWNAGWFTKRVGKMYNDNGGTHEAITINPFVISNVFVNYSLKNMSTFLKGGKVQPSVNNLFDKHSIVGVTPASKTSSVAAAGDQLTLLPARSVSLALTVDF